MNLKDFYAKLSVFVMVVFFMLCCQHQDKPIPPKTDPVFDIHSFAREAIIHHAELDLEVDFITRRIIGVVTYQIEPRGQENIFFDTQGPDVTQVKVDGKQSQFTFGLEDKILGKALIVPIKSTSKSVEISYTTQADAAALQWLTPQQTAGKKHPFLFSQGQAILTRTWIPIQDSPGIRFRYKARVKVPKELMAVMSATNVESKSIDGIYHFEMPQPVPAYLIAIAVGDLQFEQLGPRSGVYAEPSMLAKAVYEFSDTEKMINTAESLYGPYAWDRYDLLVLPPSFPFGGMENPRLTFVTPTVIAGDRSLVSLIAHELAHSWSGNYVTNADWNDFWINEGFTTYFERRIMESLYGKEYTDMLAVLAKKDWVAANRDIGSTNKDTHLHLDLKGRNPDDGMNSIAYEKGAFMLQMLEDTVGRDTFDLFLNKYFSQHAFQSMNSAKLLDYMNHHLPIDSLRIDLKEWIYNPGIPANAENPVSNRFEQVDTAYQKMFKSGKWAIDGVKKWSSHEWVRFISQIQDTAKPEQLKAIDKAYHLTVSGNSEILNIWFEKAIRTGYSKEIMAEIEAFLIQIGRRKYLVPIYRALRGKGQIETARRIYLQAKPNYHSIAVNTIDQLLKE